MDKIAWYALIILLIPYNDVLHQFGGRSLWNSSRLLYHPMRRGIV